MKPVALPPGWARLSTIPAPTGSATDANTMGGVRLICCNAVTARVPLAKMMSGASATNSAAYFALRSALSSLQGCQSVHCGQYPNPIPASLGERPQVVPGLLDCPQPGS